MRIVFCGSSEFGIPTLEALAGGEHQIVHIFTQPAQPAGRGRHLRPTPVAQWAHDNGRDVTETDNINSPQMLELIAGLEADLMVVIAFGQKISQDVIGSFKHRAINLHASLLPAYRGAAPINRAIIDGNKTAGVTIITLAEKMDAGEMLGKAETEITEDDNAKTVHDRLAAIGAPLMLETIEKIADGTAVYEPQDHSKATIAKKMKKTDGLIDFSKSADEVVNLIKGTWPWPGAQAEYVSARTGRSCRVTIAKARAVAGPANNPTQIGIVDDQLRIICAEGRLEILEIKPAGKSVMDFQAFVNGRQSCPGDMFVSVK